MRVQYNRSITLFFRYFRLSLPLSNICSKAGPMSLDGFNSWDCELFLPSAEDPDCVQYDLPYIVLGKRRKLHAAYP